MKRIIALLFFLAMLCSIGIIIVCASAETAPVGAVSGAFAGGSKALFEPVGRVKIKWDAQLSEKIDLSDGDLTDWTSAGYLPISITPNQMISWMGNGNKASNQGEGDPDPYMPVGWEMKAYFAADPTYLYIALAIVDDCFVPSDGTLTYNGDAVQIGVDLDGRIQKALESDSKTLLGKKNIFYSLGCMEHVPAVRIMRQESHDDRWLSEQNGDAIKGAAKATANGWSCELALSWDLLYNDNMLKLRNGNTPIYLGGKDQTPLQISLMLCYLSRNETAGAVSWAAATCKALYTPDGCPGVSWTPYDNGIQLELEPVAGMWFQTDHIMLLEADAPDPTTAKTTAKTTAVTGATKVTTGLTEAVTEKTSISLTTGVTLPPNQNNNDLIPLVSVIILLLIFCAIVIVMIYRMLDKRKKEKERIQKRDRATKGK